MMTSESNKTDKPDYLTGQLLIAMPQMEDPRFARTVIYLCAHTADGAMGLVLNKITDSIDFSELLNQLRLSPGSETDDIRVHFGGPVETGRGFVLHSADFREEASLVIENTIALTATVDILRAIATGKGPEHSLFALGYAGWGPGQLDSEIQSNGWLNAPADLDIIFGPEIDTKWMSALTKLGIDVSMLSASAGHA
jgi:putative transcriptional regulator